MKKTFIVICLVGIGKFSIAQTNTFPDSGNVGIGTLSPGAKLDVSGTIRNIDPGGFIGLKTLSGTSYSRMINTDIASSVTQGGLSLNGFVSTGSNDLVQDNASLPTWMSLFSADRDDFQIKRAAPGSTAPANFSAFFAISNAGNVGIGTLSSAYTLNLYRRGAASASLALTGDSGHSGQPTALIFRDGNTTIQDRWTFAIPPGGENNTDNGDGSDLILYRGVNGTNSAIMAWDRMTGNVLVGKTSQSNTAYKLDVDGAVRANEIKVNSNGADFVFDKDYKLPALEEVENFIATHKHLPEIPSAKNMQNDGVSVGEMQTKLLQKVEELTLYLIDQNKVIKDLRTELKLLKQN